MSQTKTLMATIFLLGIVSTVNSMKTPTMNTCDALERLQQKATFMYEQSFFCELLLAIVQTRRTDEFHADVLRASDIVNKMVSRSLQSDSIKFDEDTPGHEKMLVSNIYYTFRYLTKQKAYSRLKTDFNDFHDKDTLPYLESIIFLLKEFAAKKIDKKRELLEYLYNSHIPLINILDEYKSTCIALRYQYRIIIGMLRSQVLATRHNTQYLFHKYLENPRQILLPCLDHATCSMPSSSLLKYIPIYNESFTPFYSDSPEEHSDDELILINPISMQSQGQAENTPRPSTASPKHTFTHIAKKCLDNGSLLFLHDFQNFWVSRVSTVLYNEQELIQLTTSFLKSYHKNMEVIEDIKSQYLMSPDHDSDTGQCLTTINDLGINFLAIQNNPIKVTDYIPCLAKTIENSLINRSSFWSYAE